jgi:hypothetical protein
VLQAKSIADRPAYAIRLANRDLWQAGTGYKAPGAALRVETR